MENSQRARLLNAVIELGAERGFQALTIAEIVGRAGVPRRTFYAFFDGKDACCIAAVDYAATEIIWVLATARGNPELEMRQRVAAYIGALLAEAVRRPALIAMLTTDGGVGGPIAAVHQRALRARLADAITKLMAAARRRDPEVGEPCLIRSLAIVGAVNEIVQQTVQQHGSEALPDLREQLTDVVVALQRT